MAKSRAVFVDGVNKGLVYRRPNGRLVWVRGGTATDMFHRKATVLDVADWARKCCSGKTAKVCFVKDQA